MSEVDPPVDHPQEAPGDPAVHVAVRELRAHLEHLEHLVGAAGTRPGAAWRRATKGEHRLPVVAVVACAIALQLALPSRLAIDPRWILPALEAALGLGLTAANPGRIDYSSQVLRWASVLLIALISLANGWSAALLVHGLVEGTAGSNATLILVNGGEIYLTNIIVFGLWYWELDRGGPAARTRARKSYPDFMFPQMSNPELAPPGWTTRLADYLWLSYTNATAFSPTDIMPMSRWAKQLMMVQSAISLVTVALVVARAVNILR